MLNFVRIVAHMAELVDAPDLGSGGVKPIAGSTPVMSIYGKRNKDSNMYMRKDC